MCPKIRTTPYSETEQGIVFVVRLIRSNKIWLTLDTALDYWHLPAVTLAPDIWQLSAVPLIKEESHQRLVGFSLYSCCSVRLYAGFTVFSIQRASARASGYRVTTQTGPSARSMRPLGEDETLPQGRDLWLRRLLSICFMHPDPVTDSNWAILIVTSSLQACWPRSSAWSVVHQAGSWLSQSLPIPNITRSD